MNTQKRLFWVPVLLAAGLIIPSLNLCAQQWNAAIKRAGKKAVSSTQTEQAAKRVAVVEQAFQKTPKSWLHRVYKEPTDLTDDFYGKNAERWLPAWLQRSNRLSFSERLFKEALSRRIAKQEKQLLQNLVTLSPQSAVGWAKLIPPEAKIIFVGEYHLPKTQNHVAHLIQAYQRKHPKRQIIVLTEFAQDRYPYFLSAKSKEQAAYLKNFFSLLPDKQIKIAGLEEQACIQTRVFSDEYAHIGGTKMGVVVRNEHWLKRIEQWRARYPEAVFFVYTGGAHSELRELFALGHHFPMEESFVISFLPSGKFSLFQDTEIFHAFTQGKFYCPGVLLWKDRATGRFVGFDMQVIFSPR